jgi:cell division protein FtsL
MAITDKNGDHILTLEGMWSLAFKAFLVILAPMTASFIMFVVWVINKIFELQKEHELLAAAIKPILEAAHH